MERLSPPRSVRGIRHHAPAHVCDLIPRLRQESHLCSHPPSHDWRHRTFSCFRRPQPKWGCVLHGLELRVWPPQLWGPPVGPRGHQARPAAWQSACQCRVGKAMTASQVRVPSALGARVPGVTMGSVTVASREGYLCVLMTSLLWSRVLSARLRHGSRASGSRCDVPGCPALRWPPYVLKEG